MRCAILLGGAIAASILTQVFDFTIPRFNNVFTAAWLIYVGMQVVQRFKIGFGSWFVLGISIICFYSFAVLRGDVHLNRNDFDDIVSLTASSFSALYIVCFVSKKCNGWFARLMEMIGRDSFYIMGLHFLAFKIGSAILNTFLGTNINPAELNGQGLNLILYVYYALIGVFMPLVMIRLWRLVKTLLINTVSE